MYMLSPMLQRPDVYPMVSDPLTVMTLVRLIMLDLIRNIPCTTPRLFRTQVLQLTRRVILNRLFSTLVHCRYPLVLDRGLGWCALLLSLPLNLILFLPRSPLTSLPNDTLLGILMLKVRTLSIPPPDTIDPSLELDRRRRALV